MAQFLRDAHITNTKVTEDLLHQLNEVFANRARPLIDVADDNEDNRPFLTFIIRFDGKGYRLFSLDELVPHFKRASVVERIIITIETSVSLRSNRLIGEHLEIRFDGQEEKNCYISVTSDDSDWVEASYSAIMDIVKKHKTRNGVARSGWSTLIIQLFGIIAGFSLSLWAASRISPSLSIENAFVITFFFALLIFSNAWGYFNNIVLAFVHKTFPNILFYRPDKDRINWLMQALIGGIATALLLYVFGFVFSYIGEFLIAIPKP